MAGARMRTKRTNLNQEGGEDEGQYAEHSRSYRGIGGGHRGNQEKTGSKGYFGQGRGSEKAVSETGAYYTFLWKQHAEKHQ